MDSERERIRVLVESQKSAKEIATILDIGLSTVYAKLKKYQFKPNKDSSTKLMDDELKLLDDYYSGNFNVHQIAHRYGATTSVIYTTLRKYNLTNYSHYKTLNTNQMLDFGVSPHTVTSTELDSLFNVMTGVIREVNETLQEIKYYCVKGSSNKLRNVLALNKYLAEGGDGEAIDAFSILKTLAELVSTVSNELYTEDTIVQLHNIPKLYNQVYCVDHHVLVASDSSAALQLVSKVLPDVQLEDLVPLTSLVNTVVSVLLKEISNEQ